MNLKKCEEVPDQMKSDKGKNAAVYILGIQAAAEHKEH